MIFGFLGIEVFFFVVFIVNLFLYFVFILDIRFFIVDLFLYIELDIDDRELNCFWSFFVLIFWEWNFGKEMLILGGKFLNFVFLDLL